MQVTARDLVAGTTLWVGVPVSGCWLASVACRLVQALDGPAPARPEDALTLLVAVGGAAVALWLWLGLVLALLGHLPGRAGRWCHVVAERTTPAVVRRCAAVVVGAGLAGALAPGTATAVGRTADGPATMAAAALSPAFAPTSSSAAAPPPSFAPTKPSAVAPPPAFAPTSPAPPPAVQADGQAPAPGWIPNRPVVRSQPSTRLVTTAPPLDEQPGVVVRRGDTLWDVVRAHLGRDATDAEVAAEWPRWHEANRAVIGADPDLLLPGQVLHAPATAGVLR